MPYKSQQLLSPPSVVACSLKDKNSRFQAIIMTREENFKEEVDSLILGCEISSLPHGKTCQVVNCLMCFGTGLSAFCFNKTMKEILNLLGSDHVHSEIIFFLNLVTPQLWNPICLEDMLVEFRILKYEMKSLYVNLASKPVQTTFANAHWKLNVSSRSSPSLDRSSSNMWYILPWISLKSFGRWHPRGPYSWMTWLPVLSWM